MSAVLNPQDYKMSGQEERALDLLGQGILPVHVAGVLGVTESAISQMISNPHFSDLLAARKYEAVQKHNQRDNKLDGIEDKLIATVERSLPMIIKPMEAIRALKEVNSMKRRGTSAPESITAKQEVTQLIMPVAIMNQFSVDVKINAQNQLVQAGDAPLITIQSGNMESLLSKHRANPNERGQNVPILPSTASNAPASS